MNALIIIGVLIIGGCIGCVAAALASAASRADEQAEWGRERNELIARVKKSEAELWRKAHE